MARAENTSDALLKARLGFALCALALLLFGLVMAYSASTITSISEGVNANSYLISQGLYAFLGLVAAGLVVFAIPFDFWRGNLTWLVWGLCLVLILYTALAGTSHGGAVRWVTLFGRELQPSEFAKIGFALAMSKIVYDMDLQIISRNAFAAMLVLLILVPLAVIFVAQSDLGTTVICGLCIMAVLYYSDKDIRIVLGLVLIALILVIVLSQLGFRSERFVYLNPKEDGEGGFGSGYQTLHSQYALANGGFFGTGLGNSLEKFLYLPANNTDYVFAVICEELGTFGGMVIMALFIALLYFGLRIAQLCTDRFSRSVAGALSTMLVAQAFLNMGCAISLFPMTGKPLPFFSVGGSSMISTLIIVGFVLAASRDAAAQSDEALYERRRGDLKVTTHTREPLYEDDFAPSAPRSSRTRSKGTAAPYRGGSSVDRSSSRRGRGRR